MIEFASLSPDDDHVQPISLCAPQTPMSTIVPTVSAPTKVGPIVSISRPAHMCATSGLQGQTNKKRKGISSRTSTLSSGSNE